MRVLTLLLLALIGIFQPIQAQEDQYQWLEEVDGKKALEFVEAQNNATLEILSNENDYQQIFDKCLEIFNSPERIAYPTIRGEYVYNFWKDKQNVRGIRRRTLKSDYLSGNPDWKTSLDIDELSRIDNIKWVYKEAIGCHPSYDHFLISLSKGGGDEVVIKEFDVNKKEFIENGFFIDEAKSFASYVDENTLIVSTNFGDGTMTTSGYPRQVKLWHRGTPLKDAQLIYEGKPSDVGTQCRVLRDGSRTYTLITHSPTFYTSHHLIWKDNRAIKLDLPDSSWPSVILNNQLIIQLNEDWTVNAKTYKTETLLSINFTELLKGNKVVHVIIEPDQFSSISKFSTTRNFLLVNLLKDVSNYLYIYSFINETWTNRKVNAPDFGTVSIVGTDESSDHYFFNFQNFITPPTLYSADAGKNTFKVHQSLPAFFEAGNFEVKQYKAKSKDGTMIPYFMVSGKEMKNEGTNPTLISAYGGFGVSQQPFYPSNFGVAWLDKGGIFVLANIRGGGEYGFQWHQDGMKENRQNTFDDLYAVSEDLIAKKVTSTKHLGFMGGSNGGLLAGVAFTQRPDLYNAVVCQVPLLDMQRYNKLLAGPSWVDEYGNPDIPEEWEYIKKYSPYHNLKKGMNYPEVFFYSSTRDDRVHPGHARKMVAKMNDMGYKTFYYENTEGGHAGSSTNKQLAKMNAMIFSYLLMKLK